MNFISRNFICIAKQKTCEFCFALFRETDHKNLVFCHFAKQKTMQKQQRESDVESNPLFSDDGENVLAQSSCHFIFSQNCRFNPNPPQL